MAKKYPRSQAIQNHQYAQEDAYHTWDESDMVSKRRAIRRSGQALEEYTVIEHSSASHRSRDFSDISPGISSRPGMTRDAYDYYRPDEAIPKKYGQIIKFTEEAYQHVGLIRNIIDLMGDFASQGIRVVHKDKTKERTAKNWFERVSGPERSERFLNNLYRTGTVVVRIQHGKLPQRLIEELARAADADFPITKLDDPVQKRVIPAKYTFLDPAIVRPVGGALASFVGKKQYAISIPSHLRRIINNPSPLEKPVVEQLPTEIRVAAKNNKPYVLPADKTRVFHYKKDDWQEWAYPMLYSILDDVVLLDKMKLADTSALDGAISNIRIFKLGSIKDKIMPSAAAAAKLAQILQSNTGVGTIDLVWDDAISLVESSTQIHQFLGEEKYKPVLAAIYAGLGIPPTLTGTYGAAGTTNNYISLKTLTQRLEYGRRVLLSFWNEQLRALAKALGWREAPKIEFDVMDLANEEAMKKLYMDLADRSIISDEVIQHIFGRDPEIENSRLIREQKQRDNGKMVSKSGPFYESQMEFSLQKIALQAGSVTPSEVGLELQQRKSGEKPALEMKAAQKAAQVSMKKKGQPGQGRPKLSRDSRPRKTKTFTPRGRAMTELWANMAQADIAEVVNPIILEQFGKKNMRSLSSEEAAIAEKIKFGVLIHLEPFSDVSEENVYKALQAGAVPRGVSSTVKKGVSQLGKMLGRTTTLDEERQVQAAAYALYYGED